MGFGADLLLLGLIDEAHRRFHGHFPQLCVAGGFMLVGFVDLLPIVQLAT